MSSENRELELADKNMIIKHVKSIKKYSKEEEKEVLEKYKTITDEEEKIKMRNEIANHYLDKILAICFMYKKDNRALNWEDLFQESYISILKAIDCAVKKEKIEKDNFDSYLNCWIRGAIYKAITEKGYNIKKTKKFIELRNKYNKLKTKYNIESDYLTEDELLLFAKELNASIDSLKILEEIPTTCYLDIQTIDYFSDRVLLDEEETENCKSCEDLVIEKLFNEELNKEFNCLSEEAQEVLKRRYGFYGKPQSIEKIARETKHGKRKVKIIEERGLTRLKNRLK